MAKIKTNPPIERRLLDVVAVEREAARVQNTTQTEILTPWRRALERNNQMLENLWSRRKKTATRL